MEPLTSVKIMKPTIIEKPVWELLHEKAVSAIPADVPIFIEKGFDIADRLNSILVAKGLTQSDLAALTGKTNAEVSRWCAGHQNLTLRTIAKIEAALEEDVILVLPKNVNGKQAKEWLENLYNNYGQKFQPFHSKNIAFKELFTETNSYTTEINNEIEAKIFTLAA